MIMVKNTIRKHSVEDANADVVFTVLYCIEA